VRRERAAGALASTCPGSPDHPQPRRSCLVILGSLHLAERVLRLSLVVGMLAKNEVAQDPIHRGFRLGVGRYVGIKLLACFVDRGRSARERE